MFGLDAIAGLAGGGGGGGAGGLAGLAAGGVKHETKSSQDGNTLRSGNSGDFNVGGGGGLPAWAIVSALAFVGLLAGAFLWLKR